MAGQVNTHLVAKRSGWTVAPDDPQPGDVIEFPPALSDPRGPERYARHEDYESYLEDEPPLTIEVVEGTAGMGHPACCGFCSPPAAIAERGVYQPDYKLVTPDGTAVVYTCHACIADAPKRD